MDMLEVKVLVESSSKDCLMPLSKTTQLELLFVRQDRTKMIEHQELPSLAKLLKSSQSEIRIRRRV